MNRKLISASTIAVFLFLTGAAFAQGMPVLVETFDDPALPNWEYSGEVSAEQGRLRIAGPGIALHNSEWSGDLSFSVWVRRPGESTVIIGYHANRLDAYLIRLESDRVALSRERGSSVETAFEIPAGEWFQVSASVEGELHTVAIDGEPILSLTDSGDGQAGSIGLEAQNAVAEFDDLIVRSAGTDTAARPTPPPGASASSAPPGECTYHLTPEGDDEGDGTEAQPWRTFARADAAVQPGDVICVAAGDYTGQETIYLTSSGASGAPITYTAYNGDVTLHELEIDFGVSHLRLHGFTVTDYANWGVTISGNNDDIALSGMRVGGGETGIRITYEDGTPVSNITIADSVIHGAIYTSVDCTPGPCNNMRFTGLEIYGNDQDDLSYGSDGIAVETGANILVEGCYIHDNSGDGIDLNSRDSGPVPGIKVHGNRVFRNKGNGIKLWNGGEITHNIVWEGGENLLVTEPGTYTIANNTFASMNRHGYLVLLGGYDTVEPSTIRLYNNIFFNDNPDMGGTLVYLAEGVTLEADYNIYYNPYRENEVVCATFLTPAGTETCFDKGDFNAGAWTDQTGQGEHSLYADPMFVDAANGDFRLTGDGPYDDTGAQPGS